jgi:hypothetical protein
VSIIANSSATRIGFKIGMVLPSNAIFALRMICVSTPAMIMGLGVSENGAK